MIPSLLNNELVRKYFVSKPLETYACCMEYAEHNKPCVAVTIIQAMQTPIRKGERYLVTHDDRNWEESTRTTEWLPSDRPWHPLELRLPDSFQKQEEPYHCPKNCPCRFESPTPLSEKCPPAAHPEISSCPNCRPKDEVAGKIESLMNSYRKFDSRIDLDGFVLDLKSLVKLARETK